LKIASFKNSQFHFDNVAIDKCCIAVAVLQNGCFPADCSQKNNIILQYSVIFAPAKAKSIINKPYVVLPVATAYITCVTKRVF